MKLYFKIKATIPTNVKGGLRKLEVEVMPDYMSYSDVTSDTYTGLYVQNEQGYQASYDANTARELFFEIYAKAISFDYIMLFKQTKSGYIKQIQSNLF